MYITEEEKQILDKMRNRTISRSVGEHKGRCLSFMGSEAELHPILFYPFGEMPQKPLPIFFYIHGGGFVLGAAEMLARHAQELADCLGIAVCSVEHRLAPEHPFPCDKIDTFDTLKYLADNSEKYGIMADKLAIGGHSSGGNIAMGTALLAQQRGLKGICTLLLDYAPFDLSHSESEKIGREPFCLPDSSYELSKLYNKCYRREEEACLPLCSPLFAEEEILALLPPVLILVGGEDALCAENEAMAQRLLECGVSVDFHCFAGEGHGFTMRPSENGATARKIMEDYLCAHLCVC